MIKDPQLPNPINTPSFMRDDIDLSKVWRTFKSNAWWIATGAAVIGLATTVFFLQQPRIYAASLRLVAANNPTMNQSLNQTLVTAPGLPSGSLEGALGGSIVLRKVQAAIAQNAELNESEKQKLRNDIDRSIGLQRTAPFTLSSQIDGAFNGIYILKAEHTSPKIAAFLANTAGDALLDWDTQRALRTVNSSKSSLENQIKDLDARLARTGVIGNTPTVEQRTLLDLRLSRVEELNNISLFSRAVIGTLTVVAPAEPPLRPVRPEPYRNGALAATLSLFLLTAIALLRSQWVRVKVETGNDIKRLGLYEIATIPRVQSKPGEKTTPLQNILAGAAGQSLQFIRAYLLLLLGKETPKTILVTSSLASEGKSLMSAALARALAMDGNRVLLIDADLSKPEQVRTWGIDTQNIQTPLPSGEVLRQINVCDGKVVRTQLSAEESEISKAIQDPEQARAYAVMDNLHIIPAIKNHDQVHSALNIVQLELAIQRWSSRYDIFIIDSPPMLAVADSVMIASIVSGVVVVTEANRTPLEVLERTTEMLRVNRARIFGVVLNKVNLEDENQLISYGYGKGYGYGGGYGSGYGDEDIRKSKNQRKVKMGRK
jgi:Mrp family chromosome partitioning ATPase